MIASYKELIVWKKSVELSLMIFETTKKFPREEIFGLAAQMRRAAFSIPSNIAEGYSRFSRKEYIQFLRIGYASGAELETQLIIARKAQILSDVEFVKITDQLTEIQKMLNSLLKKLRMTPKP